MVWASTTMNETSSLPPLKKKRKGKIQSSLISSYNVRVLADRPFLATLKPPRSHDTIESALPKGFLDRTKD